MKDGVFFVIPLNPDVSEELRASAPTNPFATPQYFAARRQVGVTQFVMGLRDDLGTLQTGCAAFLRSGFVNKTLEIVSLPPVRAESAFWAGLREFSAKHGITRLELQTFASPEGVEIPPFPGEESRRRRLEFVLSLDGDPAAAITSNHRRNAKKARVAGVRVIRNRTPEAGRAHTELMRLSVDRRQRRGEDISQAESFDQENALVNTGAGELFQAVLADKVLSSVLVLRAPEGGYYQSAGTRPEGMTLGASHFLIQEIAVALKTEGASIFTLGGADEDSSLARFKSGFGASRRELSEVSCYIGPPWRRRLTMVTTLARNEPRRFRRLITGRVSRLLVFDAETSNISPGPPKTELVLRPLSAEDLQRLTVDAPNFRERQVARLNRFGASYAFGVFSGESLCHVSWLLPPLAMERDEPPTVFQPQQDDAEITCCETLPAFRGRGHFTFAIRELLEVARASGTRRIFMKTTADNRASRSAIEKAGLRRKGSVFIVEVPLTGRQVVWRLFG